MRNTGWNFLLTSSLHGTNLTCKTVVNTWQKSSLQLQCINKHVFFGWYCQKSPNLHKFCQKIAKFWFTRFRGQFCRKFGWGQLILFYDRAGDGHRVELSNWSFWILSICSLLDLKYFDGARFRSRENIGNWCPRYVKIHAPMEVLKQYGEILRMRLKLKVGPLLLSLLRTSRSVK